MYSSIPRLKHPPKLHVFGGISWRGKTDIVVFDGIMDADGYAAILRASLLPFIRRVYPDVHRLMQDNDPNIPLRLFARGRS